MVNSEITHSTENDDVLINSTILAERLGLKHRDLLNKLDRLILNGKVSRLEFQPRYFNRSRRISCRCYELTAAYAKQIQPLVLGVIDGAN